MKKECRKKANTAWKPLDEENPLFEEENEEGDTGTGKDRVE